MAFSTANRAGHDLLVESGRCGSGQPAGHQDLQPARCQHRSRCRSQIVQHLSAVM